ncbi:hypothetical protein [Haliovirga abyssi]|uniref:Lipoprotein n=1 Tax=Haliovirga abyssi TaxID=2996794 RepID=A0AAU9DB96_9FUSO|nr:hypothetical protein [Haliovirga abyssi]BDU50721.1 hypothetical protein HLVA_12900 [Haliovirga abyssi]
MKLVRIFLMLSLISISLSGCIVMTYKTNEVTKVFNNAEQQINKSSKAYNDAFLSYNGMYEGLKEELNVNNKKIAVLLSKKMQKLGKELDEFNGLKKEMDSIIIEYKKLSKNKKEFRSDEKEWKQFQEVKNKYNVVKNKIIKNGKEFQSGMNDVVKIFNKNKLIKVFNLNDILKQIGNNTVLINQSLAKQKTQFEKARTILDEIYLNINEKDISPYNNLEELMTKITQIRENEYKEIEKINKLKGKIKEISLKTAVIKNSSKEWPEFNKINNNLKETVKTIENYSASYNNEASKLVNIMNKYKINRINVIEISTKVNKMIGTIETNVNEINSEINKNKNKKLNSKQKKKISKIEAVIKKINNKKNEAKKIISEFEKEVNGKSEIAIGPGMRTHSIIVDLGNISKSLNKDISEYNKLIK